MHFKKILFILSVFLFVSHDIVAQYWLGYATMNRSGINQLHVQPASSIGNPYQYEIQFAGIESYSITPDFFPLTFKILNEDPAQFVAENHKEVVGETIAFPSFIWKVNEKNAVGLDMKLRSVFAVDPIESSFIQLLTDYIFLGQASSVQSDEKLVTRSSAWFEVGFNYSRNVFKNDHHEFNMGVTPKIIWGQGSANLVVEDANIQTDYSTGIVNLTGLVDLQYSKTADDWKLDEFTFFGRTSMAFSGGMEYIYRKDPKEDHTLKAGFSIIDVGKMKYDRSIYAGTFRADNLMVDAETFNQVDVLKAWADVVRGLFEKIPEEEDQLEVRLPTKIGFQLDYKIRSQVYVNFSNYLALNANNQDINQSPNFNTIVLTPRYEKEKWGIALPLIYNSYRGYSSGISFSYGPFYIGLINVIQSLTNKDSINNLGGYFGIKINKPFNKKDN